MDKIDWDDLFVCGEWDGTSAREAFDRFKEFRQHFDSLPKKDLISRGWIKDKNDFLSLYDYYKTMNWQQNTALFRKLNHADKSLASLWISRIRSLGQLEVFTNDLADFSNLEKVELKQISKLSEDIDNLKDLPAFLRSKGVILIYDRAIPNMKLDGVVFKLPSGHPVIGLSLRYPRLDYFWFTLMHELAHITLHSELLETPIADDFETDTESEIEISADRLAKQSLVDKASLRSCKAKYTGNSNDVKVFAHEMNVHPSIVAGLLRHESGDYSSYNQIINEINVREIIFGHD